MEIRIFLGNKLLSDSLKEKLDKSSSKHHIIAVCSSDIIDFDTLKNSDIIVTDYITVSRISRECFGSAKILMLDTGLERETIVALFLTENIAGIIKAGSDVKIFLKALDVVNKGEVWIDNPTVKSLLDRNITRKVYNSAKLTEREGAIVKLVREGYRNKEIANLLAISEQTVKAHLNRVFKKMNVNGRTEMIARLDDFTQG